MTESYNFINDKSVIVIIGGGPAGSCCAIKLKKLVKTQGINPRIILYEGKIFEKECYYNQCLGVLSPPLDKILEQELNIPFPRNIIQKKINGYYLHSEKNIIKLSGEHDPSYACRRVEFDNYLFQKARQEGVEIIPARVTDIDFNPDSAMVYSESNNIKADIIIGAFGMDDGMAKTFERKTEYRQPKVLYSIVTKIHPGEKAMQEFENYLHAFLLSSLPRVEFGAITPKGNHLSMNIAGKEVYSEMMDKFLNLPSVKETLPNNVSSSSLSLDYFKGKFPTFPAKGFCGNRYIMIGDAAGLNRPFKGKGINSAVTTGIKAAEALFNYGFSKEAFEIYRKSCKELTDDIPYGKIIRFLTVQGSKYRFLDSLFEIAKSEPLLKKAFFNIVSGQETYKKTWHETKSFRLYMKIGIKLILTKFHKKRTTSQNS